MNLVDFSAQSEGFHSLIENTLIRPARSTGINSQLLLMNGLGGGRPASIAMPLDERAVELIGPAVRHYGTVAAALTVTTRLDLTGLPALDGDETAARHARPGQSPTAYQALCTVGFWPEGTATCNVWTLLHGDGTPPRHARLGGVDGLSELARPWTDWLRQLLA